MKRLGMYTRRVSATTTPVPDHSRPRAGPVGRSSARSAAATARRPWSKPGGCSVCANSGSSCGLSPAWPGVRASRSAARSHRPQGGRPNASSPPILRWSAQVACLSLRRVLRCRAHRRDRWPGDPVRLVCQQEPPRRLSEDRVATDTSARRRGSVRGYLILCPQRGSNPCCRLESAKLCIFRRPARSLVIGRNLLSLGHTCNRKDADSFW
jgi:hypothetical protein